MDNVKIDNYVNKIKAIERVYVDLEILKGIINYSSQAELKRVIDQLIEMEIISEVKTAAKTYQIPQIYTRYKVIKESNAELLDEIKFNYNPCLDLSYYKTHIKEYIKDKKNLELLSQFFYEKANNRFTQMSLNERSLYIFKNEKYLSMKDGKTLLSRVKISTDELDIYRTPEPFFYYINKGSHSNKVLIIENKDTWYTIRKHVRNGRSILGEDFKAIIYGEGRKILSSFGDIDFDEYEEFNDPRNKFYYFGDIDAHGINILKELQERYTEYMIMPFAKAYRYLLLHRDKGRVKDTIMNCAFIESSYTEKYFNELTIDEQELICNICNRNEILPQEILNNQVLLEDM